MFVALHSFTYTCLYPCATKRSKRNRSLVCFYFYLHMFICCKGILKCLPIIKKQHKSLFLRAIPRLNQAINMFNAGQTETEANRAFGCNRRAIAKLDIRLRHTGSIRNQGRSRSGRPLQLSLVVVYKKQNKTKQTNKKTTTKKQQHLYRDTSFYSST